MTEAEAVEAICARWASAWPAAQPTIPFALPNEAQPSAGVVSFVNVVIGAIGEKQISQGAIGTRIFERRGTVEVRLFGAVDVGENPLALLMGTVRDVLGSQELGGAPGVQAVQMYAVSSDKPVKQGSWYTKTARVPFCFYERR